MLDSKGFLDAGGRRIEYSWHGPGPEAGTTLVFLHEGLGCVELWRDFPARVAEASGLGALVYSRHGYGRSDPCELPRPITYMHDEAKQDLPLVLEAAGVREAILVGHSDGGSIAIIHSGGARAVPIRALVLMAAHVFTEQISVESIAAAGEAYASGDLKARLERYHGDNTECAFRGWCDAWLDPDFLQWNIEEFLPGIDVPSLVIQGRDDQYGTLAQVKSIVAGIGDTAKPVVLENCGHAPFREQVEATLAAVTGFLARVIP